MRCELHRNQVTDAQTIHKNLNGVSAGTHEAQANNSRGDMLASLEVGLHWLGSAVVVAFIGLAIIEPERVERALTQLMFKTPNGHRIQIANVRWSPVEMAKSDDGIKQIDAEHKFEVINSPSQVTDDFDRGSQSQTDIPGSTPIPTSSAAVTDDFDQRSQSQTDIPGSAPIPTSSAAGSIDIDRSLAIEFPTAAHEPHKSADAMKRHPLSRAKVAAKRSGSNNPQANSEANSKPVELPPNFTNSAYWRQLMQIVPPRYLVPSGRHPIIEALAPEVKSWFADTVAEPIPEELQLILRRIDTYAERTRSIAMGTA
jgi:hypothetical protein